MSEVSEKDTVIDLSRLAILLQRRYNILRELKESTKELSDAVARNDTISIDLVIRMREDDIGRSQKNWEEIMLMAEESEAAAEIMKRLVLCEIEEAEAQDREEDRILDIRRKILPLLQEIKDRDRMLSQTAERNRRNYRNR